MMRSGLLLIAIWIAPMVSVSQDFNAGILAGMNMSQVDGDRMAGYNKINGTFGVFVNRKFNSVLRAQMEMIYTGKGSKRVADPDRGITDFRKISLHYLEVPLTLQIWYEKYRIHVDIGLSVGALLSQREVVDTQVLDIVGPFRQTELGFIFGINYSITEQIAVSLRFAYSILPVANKALITVWHTYGGSYNNLVGITLLYQLSKSDS